MRQRVAVFVDGENLSSGHAEDITRVAADRGDVILARVYGDVNRLNGWRDAAQFTAVHSGTGKNAADILLSLEAFEQALSGRFDACVVGSTDRDFSHLAVKLRERGVHVVGAGEANTPKEFAKRCSKFITLGKVRGNAATASAARKFEEADLNRWIAELIGQDGTDGWIPVQLLGAKMHKKHGVRCNDLAAKNWPAYLAERESHYVVDVRDADACVRLKPSAPLS